MKFSCAHHYVVDIKSINPHPKNPNTHPESQIVLLAKIIDYQGQRSPIVISNRSGYVTKGHGRLEALKLLGWTEAAVDFQDYDSAEQEYADMEADNRIAELSKIDEAKSEMNMKEFFPPQFDLELIGIPNKQEDEAPPGDEDDVPDVPTESKVKRGDLFGLGAYYECEGCGEVHEL